MLMQTTENNNKILLPLPTPNSPQKSPSPPVPTPTTATKPDTRCLHHNTTINNTNTRRNPHIENLQPLRRNLSAVQNE